MDLATDLLIFMNYIQFLLAILIAVLMKWHFRVHIHKNLDPPNHVFKIRFFLISVLYWKFSYLLLN